jgi:ubiquinone/menaquinone biosynthesis C-methylase UbiE
MSFASPDSNISQLGKIDGFLVADFGAGTGAYTIPLARKVGEKGRVYAIEVQKELLPRIKNTAINQGLSNVEVLWGDVERHMATKLANNSIDLVILANVFFQADNKIGLTKEAKRVLKSGGKLLFVDWKDSYGGFGPQPESIVLPVEARKYFETEGFAYEKDIQAGEQHYGFICTKVV